MLIMSATLATIALIYYRYRQEKNLKKILISLGTFAVIVALGVVGNITRAIVPLFIAHEILIIIAWGALFFYLFKNRYCIGCFLAPLATIVLFFILAFLGGSSDYVF